MKIKVLKEFRKQALESFLRFPLVLLSSVFAGFVAIYMVSYSRKLRDEDTTYLFTNILLILSLGISLYFSVYMIVEKYQIRKTKSILALGAATLLLIALYLSFPDMETHSFYQGRSYVRFAIYAVIIHLSVAFGPFLKKGELTGFWNFNHQLFSRLFLGAFFSGILWIGISLGMLAIDFLFQYEFKEVTYFKVFIIVLSVFNTWFFLSGAPKDFKILDTTENDNKGFRIFSQYILIPILSIYLLILYVYAFKIAFTGTWPKGSVSYLVSGIGIFGIFTVLFLYPYQKHLKWVRNYSKIIYLLFVPLLLLLFLALGMRVSDYGLTVNRYLIALLGIWLTLISVYFIAGKKNIKLVPISLAIILALMSFGPWSMFSLPGKSQVQRLEDLLAENNLLNEQGKIKNEVIWVQDSLPKLVGIPEELNMKSISDKDLNAISSKVRYIIESHGYTPLNSLFSQPMSEIARKMQSEEKYINFKELYMRSLGFAYAYDYKRKDTKKFNFYTENRYKENVISTSGYSYFFNFSKRTSSYKDYESEEQIILFKEEEEITMYFDFYLGTINVKLPKEKVEITLAPLMDSLKTKTNNALSLEELTLKKESKYYEIKIELENFNFIQENQDPLIYMDIEGILFFKEKENKASVK